MLETPIEQTDDIKSKLKTAFASILKITTEFSVTRDRGYYGVLFVRPSKTVRTSLSIDRELLVLISTFEDQQTRTIQTAKDIIDESEGRLDSSTFIVVHRDPQGNSKLKKWGREQSLSILPIHYKGSLPSGDALLHSLAYELYSYDTFDVTGPVADDLQFYGRREEARELAKKLQLGQIRSCFGIRKIGKTSILHRVINEVRANYSCTILLLDAQSDSIFELDAARLINSLAQSLTNAKSGQNINLAITKDEIELVVAVERLRAAVEDHHQHILIVFDEIDYLTPTSPTAPHWRTEFNKFWRNLRAIYQATAATDRSLSLLISGVSSKWFSEESIDGVENSVLSFVPEEYLSPLPRGAAAAMIRRLGKPAGLLFSDPVAEYVAEACADMPFWIRKACSYIHRKIEIGLRPLELDEDLVKKYLKEFLISDGVAMSEVALTHLFRVFPELRAPALSCAEGKTDRLNPRTTRTLGKYGIIRTSPKPIISGQMMFAGLENLQEDEASHLIPAAIIATSTDYGDWADELAIISRRRNIVEKKLRNIAINFIRFSSMSGEPGSPKERVLRCIDTKRRPDLERFDLDKLSEQLYWLELIKIVKKEWPLFQKIFGDRSALDSYAQIVNERPDAHAKDLDMLDLAQHRSAISWFEDKLGRV